MTYRQLLVLEAWQVIDRDRPSKLDNYLAQISMLLELARNKKASRKLEKYHIVYAKKVHKPPEGTKAAAPNPMVEASKSRWRSILKPHLINDKTNPSRNRGVTSDDNN